MISDGGRKVEFLGEGLPDWRVTLVDTGIWRNIGQRLCAVRDHVKDEEMFLANYSDGLTDAPLPEMVELLEKTGKTGCFLAVRPPLTFHLVEFDEEGEVRAHARERRTPTSGSTPATSCSATRSSTTSSDGEELVVEPFQRLIEAGELIAYRHDGFFRAMDTLRDKQILEDMVQRGEMPWQPKLSALAAVEAAAMKGLRLAEPGQRLSVLCLGAHCDDIEIGAGGTILQLAGSRRRAGRAPGACCRAPARARARRVPRRPTSSTALSAAAVEVHQFRDGYFPAEGAEIKAWFEGLKRRLDPE